MKIYNDVGAQGDLLFVRVDSLPEGLVPNPDEVLAHSESGHHHLMKTRRGFQVERLDDPKDPLTSYLRITRRKEEILAGADETLAKIDQALLDVGVVIHHEKTGPDAHDDSGLACEGDQAIYKVPRQMEQGPTGWQRVAD